MSTRGHIAPIPQFDDLPPWPDNRDAIDVRVVNLAWNGLFLDNLADLSFRKIAKQIGVTTPALYHYFPSHHALGVALAKKSIEKLADAITEPGNWFDGPRPKRLKDFTEAWLAFAAKRPRHYGLIFDPQFNKDLQDARWALVAHCSALLISEVGQARVSSEHLHVFLAALHGPAALVASGHISRPAHVLAAIRAVLGDFRPG